MKRLNVSILAVVALLTLGLTAFTKSDKKSDLLPVTNCYGNLNTQFDSNCVPSVYLLHPRSLCYIASDQLTKKVSWASNFFGIIECDLVENYFCCAQLVVDPAPCPGQTRLTFVDVGGVLRVNEPAMIYAVYCRSTSN